MDTKVNGTKHAPFSASPLRLTEASTCAFPVCLTRSAAKGLAGRRRRNTNCVAARVSDNQHCVCHIGSRHCVVPAAAVRSIDDDVVRLERISEASISRSQVRLQEDRVHDTEGREAAQGASNARSSQGRRDELKAETEASDRDSLSLRNSVVVVRHCSCFQDACLGSAKLWPDRRTPGTLQVSNRTRSDTTLVLVK